jgi:hypothetical protein
MATLGSHGGEEDWRGGSDRRAPGGATEGIRFSVCDAARWASGHSASAN